MADTVKKNLLSIVQEVLISINGDNVSSIADTEEANDIATIAQGVYFDMVTRGTIPETREVIQLTAVADSERPTYFQIPDNVKFIERLDYDVSTTSGTTTFRTLTWYHPTEFLDIAMTKNVNDTTHQLMLDINNNTTLVIRNNAMPNRFTSFDDKHIVCDSFDSAEESTLQTSKTRAYVVKVPVFTLSDTFIPEIDEGNFRAFVNEVRSTSAAILNRQVNPKLEQGARKQRMLTQNDKLRVGNSIARSFGYGRT